MCISFPTLFFIIFTLVFSSKCWLYICFFRKFFFILFLFQFLNVNCVNIFRSIRVNQRIIRWKGERKWYQKVAQRLSEEENLLIPYNFPEEDVYDFYGMDGKLSIFEFQDSLEKRRDLKRKHPLKKSTKWKKIFLFIIISS